MKCPKCKRGNVRVKVSLFLDIPFELHHRLSKANLRSRDTKIEGQLADVYVVLHEVHVDRKARMTKGRHATWFSLGLFIERRGNSWTTWTFE